jgi:VanZ family protein
MNNTHQKLAHLQLAGYWICLFVVTHLPPTRLPKTRISDKFSHFAAYAVLAALLIWSLRQLGCSLRAAAWSAIAICLAYGAIDEYLQIYVGRICSLRDWLADVTGAVAVAAVVVVAGALRDVRQT